MANENTGLETIEKSEAEAILEFLPDEAAILQTGEAEAEVDADLENGEDEASTEDLNPGQDEETTKDAEAEPNAKVQKRIDQLTARAKTAEEALAEKEAEIARLNEELTNVPETATVTTSIDPLADVADEAGLGTKARQAMQVKRWCIENPEGGTVKDKDGNDIEIEPVQVRKMLADAEEMMALNIPVRRQYLAEKASHDAEAKTTYPELFQSGSEMAKQAGSLLKAWPDLKRFPDYRMVLGDYISGHKARTAKKDETQETKAAAAKAGPAKPKPTVAPPVPRMGVAKPKTKDPVAQVVNSGGTQEALTDYFSQ